VRRIELARPRVEMATKGAEVVFAGVGRGEATEVIGADRDERAEARTNRPQRQP
jgi:hypothetical protein